MAFVMGDRGRATSASVYGKRAPKAIKEATCYSDFWESYQEVIPGKRHRATGKEEGETSHVERWINTLLRQRLSRLVRKTLSRSASRLRYTTVA